MLQAIRQLRIHDPRATSPSGSKAEHRRRFDSDTLDTLLLKDEEPQLGAQVVARRRHYSHHGIYVGGGRVVHYAGFAYGFSSGPVEEVSLDEFALNRPIWVRRTAHPVFPPQEVIRRARRRVGENRYQLLRNNCEHFCEWCLHGAPRSHQVECLSIFGQVVATLVPAVATLLRAVARLEVRVQLSRPRRVAAVDSSTPPKLGMPEGADAITRPAAGLESAQREIHVPEAEPPLIGVAVPISTVSLDNCVIALLCCTGRYSSI